MTSKRYAICGGHSPGGVCRNRIVPEDNYCSRCGDEVRKRGTECKCCYQRLSSHAQFCTRCGFATGVYPGGPTKSLSGPVVSSQDPSTFYNVIEAVEFRPGSGLALDLKTNFVLRPPGLEDNGKILCLGKSVGGEIVPLSSEDKVKARGMGLTVNGENF